MNNLFSGIYKGCSVLVTGHTGFKGSWLVYWLEKMGAKVVGYSLDIPTDPNHFELLHLKMPSLFGDIRDSQKLDDVMNKYKPEIVFHLAAQPLVRRSYSDPLETFDTNIVGTVKLFEACRKSKSVKAIVNITSDKCYENKEWYWGYRECDPMGGHDPYSASKGCAELVTQSYQKSFFNVKQYGIVHNILLASCRAGNVIGGGDWADDRIVPDVVRATVNNEVVQLRNPNAVRPWQHVLEPLSGYLLVGQKLLQGDLTAAEAWNFGPSGNSVVDVNTLVVLMKENWNDINYRHPDLQNKLHEANLLKLDSSKANSKLQWTDVWDCNKAITKTINWYKKKYLQNELDTEHDLSDYIEDAKKLRVCWSNR